MKDWKAEAERDLVKKSTNWCLLGKLLDVVITHIYVLWSFMMSWVRSQMNGGQIVTKQKNRRYCHLKMSKSMQPNYLIGKSNETTLNSSSAENLDTTVVDT